MPWNPVATGTLRALNAANVAATFPGGNYPRFFMSGDGHRSPPFEWSMGAANPLKLHFLSLMATGDLCVHVEMHQDEVTPDSVPGALQPLFGQQRIFGWELPFYKHLQTPMEESMSLAGNVGVSSAQELSRQSDALDRELVRLHALLHMVGNPPALTTAMLQHQPFCTYYRGVKNGQPPVAGTDDNYRAWLIAYYNAAMGLRTTVNNFIGARINGVINAHPTKTHLITCGDAHILHNDLSQYVLIPAADHGVVDASNV